MTIEFYRLKGCPYCAKVKRKLDALNLGYRIHDVPGWKAKRTEVKEVSGQAGVPVIVDEKHGIEGMAESDDIISYLEKTYA